MAEGGEPIDRPRRISMNNLDTCPQTFGHILYIFVNAGRLDDSYVLRFIKEKLKSMPCQNQGYVLDGYPKTYEQAKELFNSEEGEEAEESRSKAPRFDKTITPDVSKDDDPTYGDILKQITKAIGSLGTMDEVNRLLDRRSTL